MLVHVLMALKLPSQLFIQSVHLNIIISTQSCDQSLKCWGCRPEKVTVLCGSNFPILCEKSFPLTIVAKQHLGMWFTGSPPSHYSGAFILLTFYFFIPHFLLFVVFYMQLHEDLAIYQFTPTRNSFLVIM